MKEENQRVESAYESYLRGWHSAGHVSQSRNMPTSQM